MYSAASKFLKFIEASKFSRYGNKNCNRDETSYFVTFYLNTNNHATIFNTSHVLVERVSRVQVLYEVSIVSKNSKCDRLTNTVEKTLPNDFTHLS